MNREQYLETVVPLAARLVATVHDEGPDATDAVLDAINAVPAPDEVRADAALAVILAAMVDPNRSPHDLLAWTLAFDGDPVPHFHEAPANPLGLEMGLSGALPLYALNRAEQRAVVGELMNRGLTRPEIVDLTKGDRQDVARIQNVIAQRKLRAAVVA